MGFMNHFSRENKNTTNSTTTLNDSRTFNETNTLSNSWNSTANSTNTNTQDQRMINDRGVGVSADNGTVFALNTSSNETVNSSRNDTSDNHSFWSDSSTYSSTSINTGDFGAISAGRDVALGSLNSQQKTMDLLLAATRDLGKSGMSMIQANLDYATHLSDSNQANSDRVLSQVKNTSENALAQVAAIAAKPLNAQNPQHILVIVGLVVCGVFAFKSFKG